MLALLLAPFLLQALLIGVDEFHFHRRRGLPRWERIGHPLDTLSVFLCFLFLLLVPYSPAMLKLYIGLALFSCFFVTKDEFVHKECCPATEQWLHAVLFLNHPVLMTIGGIFWYFLAQGQSSPFFSSHAFLHAFLQGQTAMICLFALYQAIYWNIPWKRART